MPKCCCNSCTKNGFSQGSSTSCMCQSLVHLCQSLTWLFHALWRQNIPMWHIDVTHSYQPNRHTRPLGTSPNNSECSEVDHSLHTALDLRSFSLCSLSKSEPRVWLAKFLWHHTGIYTILYCYVNFESNMPNAIFHWDQQLSTV